MPRAVAEVLSPRDFAKEGGPFKAHLRPVVKSGNRERLGKLHANLTLQGVLASLRLSPLCCQKNKLKTVRLLKSPFTQMRKDFAIRVWNEFQGDCKRKSSL